MTSKKILVVDDIKIFYFLIRDILEDMDYSILYAENGPDALKMVEDEKPNLILLDVMMPGMDGYEVCEQLKNNPKTKMIPVLFVSARAYQKEIERGYAVGGQGYITKPFRKKDLILQIEKVFESIDDNPGNQKK